MQTTTENNNPDAVARKKRQTKDLPVCLSFLREDTFKSSLKARLETDQNELAGKVMVTHEFSLQEEDEGATFILNDLTLDQMHKLCRKLGVQYVNKCTQFQCCKALYILAKYQEHKKCRLW